MMFQTGGSSYGHGRTRRIIMIPNSDFTKIIFRRDQFSSKFKMTDFNEGYTRGVITREEA